MSVRAAAGRLVQHAGRLIVVCAALAAMALSGNVGDGTKARAAEKPSAEYVEAMRTLARVAEEMPKRVAEDDAPGMDKLVIAARPALGVIDKYWTGRGVEDAIAFSETASKAIAEISVAIHLMADGKNPLATEGAQESLKNFAASCAGCHKAHRETLPDGSYAIK